MSSEVVFPVEFATGIKFGPTTGTRIGGQIVDDREFQFADSAEHRQFMEALNRPDLRGVIGENLVAKVTRVVALATDMSDGDDIEGLMVVGAAGLFIHVNPEYVVLCNHRSPIFRAVNRAVKT